MTFSLDLLALVLYNLKARWRERTQRRVEWIRPAFILDQLKELSQ